MQFEVKQGSSVAYLHPNKSGTYAIDSGTLITFGSLHPATAESFGLSGEMVHFFEVDYTLLFNRFALAQHTFREISKYPSISRELNFVLDERTPVASVIEQIASVHPFLGGFSVVDTFRDEAKVGMDKKSVTFSFSIQDPEKTITDEQALTIQTAIIARMEEGGVELRK